MTPMQIQRRQKYRRIPSHSSCLPIITAFIIFNVSMATAEKYSGSTTMETPTDRGITSSFNESVSTIPPALIRYRGPFDVTFISRINPFWLQFEPPSDVTYDIMTAVYSIILILGTIGNTFIIFMYIRCKSLRTPANTLVINLALSDLLMLAKCPIAIYNNILKGPALGDVGCRMYGFVGGLSGTAAITTLTAIAIDRYFVVVHPLNPLRRSSKLRPHICILLIWMYSFMFSIIPALDIGLSVYVPEGFLTTCSFDYLSKDLNARIFMFVYFVAAWCLPLFIICFSYFYILRVVCAANTIQSNQEKHKTERKLAIMVIGRILLWFLAWTPYSIVAMLGVFGKEEYITPLGSMIPALFCKSAACIDPYIYAATHSRFRVEFNRFIHCKSPLQSRSTLRSSYLTRTSTTRLLRAITEANSSGITIAPAGPPRPTSSGRPTSAVRSEGVARLAGAPRISGAANMPAGLDERNRAISNLSVVFEVSDEEYDEYEEQIVIEMEEEEANEQELDEIIVMSN